MIVTVKNTRLFDIASNPLILASAQQKIRSGHKISRDEKDALTIEYSLLQDAAIRKFAAR